MGIILVAGPPCAGKNHYVEQRRQDGDVVLDQDAMGAKAYNQAIAQLERRKPTKQTWVIRCCAGQQRREHFARRIGADNIVLLTPPHGELHARAKKRPRIKRTLAAIRQWHQLERDNPAEKTPGDGSKKTPQGRKNSTARGYDYNHERLRRALLPSAFGRTCHLCGETMLRGQSLDLDHTQDRTGYRGMTHASCNRKDGARRRGANQRRSTSRAW